MKNKLITSLIALTALSAAQAQISITDGNLTYVQDFNTLPTSESNIRATNASAPAWSDNATLSGWYADGSDFISNIAIHNGSDGTPVGQNGSAPGSLGSFKSTDRAFSPMRQNRESYIGLRLVNNTSATIPDFDIEFTGEQWRSNNNTPGTLFFSYQVDAADLTAGTWTGVSQLNFTSPIVAAGAALDGNAEANRVSLSHTITDVNLAPGEEIWLRWANTTANNGIYLGIDDLTVTAIPEPGTLALLGIALGALVLFRRRH